MTLRRPAGPPRSKLESSLTVYELIDERLLDREGQLKQEIDAEFEAKRKKALRALESDPLTAQVLFLDSGASLTGEVEAFWKDFDTRLSHLEESLRAYTRVLEQNSYPLTQSGTTDLSCIANANEELAIFRTAIEAEYYSSSVVHRDSLIQRAVDHTTSALQEEASRICAHLSSELPGSHTSGFVGDSPPADIEVKLGEPHRNSPDSLDAGVSDDLQHEVKRLREMLRHARRASFDRFVEADLARIDLKYLRMIAELSNLVFDTETNRTSKGADGEIISRILPAVLSSNQFMLNDFIEGVQKFIQGRIHTDQKLARFVQFERSRWSRHANR